MSSELIMKLLEDFSVVQVIICRHLTTTFLIKLQVRSCGIYGGRNASVVGLLQVPEATNN
jgi:hypothetical protein